MFFLVEVLSYASAFFAGGLLLGRVVAVPPLPTRSTANRIASVVAGPVATVESTATVRIVGRTIDLTLSAPRTLFAAARLREAALLLSERCAVGADGQGLIPILFDAPSIESDGMVSAHLRFRTVEVPQSLVVDCLLLPEVVGHRTLLDVYDNGVLVSRRILDELTPQATVSLSNSSGMRAPGTSHHAPVLPPS